jgi:drug/metabolite transporter (DMT)-like permease
MNSASGDRAIATATAAGTAMTRDRASLPALGQNRIFAPGLINRIISTSNPTIEDDGVRQFQKISLSSDTIGLGYGGLGVLGFSLTLPATRVAVAELDPTFVGLGRAIGAAVPAFCLLWLTRQPMPQRQHWGSLAVVSGGVILGFPWLSAVAMHQLPAAHGAVIIGLVPLLTAIAGTLRAGDRPTLGFWLASASGSFTVLLFALWSGAGQLQAADGLLLLAGLAAAIGYAEGGRLAKMIGGWQVICWALVGVSPIVAIPVLLSGSHLSPASPMAWLGFGYVSWVSQLLAFFAWYHGMALGGVARVGQIQLLQPFLTMVAAAVLLHEPIAPPTLGFAAIVVISVAVGKSRPIGQR